MNPDFRNNVPAGSSVAMSETGYIKESLFLDWLKHFQQHRVPGPVILILDGHVTHCSLLALEFCERAK
jgi:transposase